MKIDAVKFGLATAAAFAIVWLVCSVLVWSMPSMMMDMTGNMMHSDWSRIGWQMTGVGVIIGMIGWSVGSGLTAWLLATVYNRLL